MRSTEFISEYEQSSRSKKIERKLSKLGYYNLGWGQDKTVWAKDHDRVVSILMPSSQRLLTAKRSFIALLNLSLAHPNNPYLPKFVKFRDEQGNESYWTEFTIDNRPYIQFGIERLRHLTNVDYVDALNLMRKLAVMHNLDWAQVERKLEYYADLTGIKASQRKDYAKEFEPVYSTIQLLAKTARDLGLTFDVLNVDNVMTRDGVNPVFMDPFYTIRAA